jgi:LSD1 subclass zinc finger protein
MHLAQVRGTSAAVKFGGNPFKPKAGSASFWAVYEAFKAQNEHAMVLHQAFGTMEKHPDQAPVDLQERLSWSLFAQGWIPYLSDQDATALLEKTGLADNYQELPVPELRERHCGACGKGLKVVAGARRVVCECGYRVEVEAPEINCTNCAALISFPENAVRVACPHCQTMLTRI